MDHRDHLTRAEWVDAHILSVIIAEAFHGLEPSRWLIPDPVARWDVFPTYFRIFVNHAMEHGAVYTNTDRTAAALWLYKGDGRSDYPHDYDRQLTAATGTWIDRFRTFDLLLDKHHPTGVRHDHLAMLAVQPGRQREGIATALLTSYHQMLDRPDVQVPAYLDAADATTRGLYLKHGYHDHGTPIHLPDGPALHPMWRPPGGRTTGGDGRPR